MAGLIKKAFPKCMVYFLGRSYTKDIIALSEHVNGFLNYDDIEKLDPAKQIDEIKKVNADVFVHVFPKKEIAHLAKKAGIPLRVGTTNRLWHWFTCNQKIKLSRKNSPLHESQLNFKLLSFLGLDTDVALKDVHTFYGFTKISQLAPENQTLLNKDKFNLILHPKSKGSAKEWGLDNFSKLISELPTDKFQIFISGTKEDGNLMKEFLASNISAVDITGKLSLQQFIAFISKADGLVAASTGPLHIAASLDRKAIGLFSPKRPIHPGRWMPIGKNATYVVFDPNCQKCSAGEDCDCITKISPKQIIDLLH